MLVKCGCKNPKQPSFNIGSLNRSFGANTTLGSSNVFYSSICNEDQSLYVLTDERSLQQVEQDKIPKLKRRGKLGNSGSPKGINSYNSTRDYRYEDLTKYGDGATVVPITNNRKGLQCNSAMLNPLGSRSYSTDQSKANVPVLEQEIECSYRQLFDLGLYKAAYDKQRSKPGNWTPGLYGETLDSVSIG